MGKKAIIRPLSDPSLTALVVEVVMDHLQRQLDEVKFQAKEDFKFTMIGLAGTRNQIAELSRRVQDGFDSLQAGLERMGSRYEQMFDICQQMIGTLAAETAQDIQLLKGRMDAVERRLDQAS